MTIVMVQYYSKHTLSSCFVRRTADVSVLIKKSVDILHFKLNASNMRQWQKDIPFALAVT